MVKSNRLKLMAGAKNTSLLVVATTDAKLSFEPKAKVVSYDENMIKNCVGSKVWAVTYLNLSST